MTKRVSGASVLLQVKDPLTNKLMVVAGQRNASLARDREMIDASDKTSDTSIVTPGRKNWGVETDGIVLLGAETARSFSLLNQAYDNGEEIDLLIRIGDKTNEYGMTYTAKGYISEFPLEFPNDDLVTFSISIQPASSLNEKVGVETETSETE